MLVCELRKVVILVERGVLKSKVVTQDGIVQEVSSIYRNLKEVS